MRDKETLMPLLHSNMLSLAVLETLCDESDGDLKSMEQRSTCLVDDLLLKIWREIAVRIIQKSIDNVYMFDIPTWTCINTYFRAKFQLTKPTG